MIADYNRAQCIRAIVAMLAGVVCCWFAWLFFRYVPAFAAGRLGYRWTPLTGNIAAVLGLLAVAASGYRTWSLKGGLQSYHESALYHDLGGGSGGTCMVDCKLHQVTAPAYLLSQLFLAGPLQLLNARTLLASRLPSSPELEGRLASTLAVLRSANKWQAISEHPRLRTEILYLAQMGLIDFSSHKGEPRIKIR